MRSISTFVSFLCTKLHSPDIFVSRECPPMISAPMCSPRALSQHSSLRSLLIFCSRRGRDRKGRRSCRGETLFSAQSVKVHVNPCKGCFAVTGIQGSNVVLTCFRWYPSQPEVMRRFSIKDNESWNHSDRYRVP